jgi:ADP-L-glycero-D-manno-heptose 6-epimerase
MLLVTGGAGFIGSNLVAGLNEAGESEIAVSDFLDPGKAPNLAKRRIAELVAPGDLSRWLTGRKLDAVLHLGAISDTTASDRDLVLGTNVDLSIELLDWCTATRTPFIYASSAATYGDGSRGFKDEWSLPALERLQPLNLYGESKHLFDLTVSRRFGRNEAMPPHWAGLKFFNVFGPNEYHKGTMASVVARVFDDAKAGKPVRLFKSYRADIADGEQRRDFIGVEDAVAVMLWFLATPSVDGIFNVGTGTARSFRAMIEAMFAALGRPARIDYIDMPPEIRDKYQYFTQADMENLRRAGYAAPFTPLEDAVARYVRDYLDRADRYR